MELDSLTWLDFIYAEKDLPGDENFKVQCEILCHQAQGDCHLFVVEDSKCFLGSYEILEEGEFRSELNSTRLYYDPCKYNFKIQANLLPDTFL